MVFQWPTLIQNHIFPLEGGNIQCWSCSRCNDIAPKNDKFVIKDNQSVTSLNSTDPASCLMLANNLFLIKIEMKHIFCMRNKSYICPPSVLSRGGRGSQHPEFVWSFVTLIARVCSGQAAALHQEYCRCYRSENEMEKKVSGRSRARLVVLKSCRLLAWNCE